MFDMNGEYIKTFFGIHDAVREIFKKDAPRNIGGAVEHICEVCKGKRKSAYGYKWKYHNVNINDNFINT